ncbi:anion permease [Candidatus Acetothermia bacterium]|nr:anion permease [Candidatus Acetothermia bacterium]
MPADLTVQQLSFLVILAVAFGLFMTERIRNDIVALLIVLALYLTRVLSSSEALSGFGSEPAIVVASIFVLTGALHHTGLSDSVGRWIGRLAGRSYTRAIAVIMPSVSLLSAFTHHVTTTAMMLPVTLNLARERRIPASKLLMPLSFAASLGTTITIIGAPAFLVASAALQQAGRPGLDIFSIAPIGLSLSLVGLIFMLLVGRFLLPSRQGGEDPANLFRLDNYFTEVTIMPGSSLVGKTLAEVKADDHYHFTVAGWVHESHRLYPPFEEERLSAGDVLLVHTTPEDIVAFRQEHGVELRPVEQYLPEMLTARSAVEDLDERLVQAVVAPNSDLVGRTLAEIDFRRRYGPIVIGLWRQEGWMQQELAHTRLQEGDVLLLLGDGQSLARVARDRDFSILAPFHSEVRLRQKAPLAGAIMLATVFAAAFNLLTLEMASLAGAVAMVLTRCITGRQAYRAIDARIYVFIAGAIPLGAAMQKTGVAALLAGWLQNAIGGWDQMWILLALFAMVGMVTQLMSDAATTALFAPVAVALAKALGQAPEPYVVTVAMAAVTAFLTPIGHHGNLLVYGPGRYQFSDFVRVGTPLTILIALVVVWLATILWPG